MLTMLSALDNALKLHGDRPAIVDEEQCFTWSQHVGRVAKAADFWLTLASVPEIATHNMRELLPIHGAHPCRLLERCHRSPDQSPISRT